MAENTQNTTATTNEGEGKEKASGVEVPTVESPKKDLPEAQKQAEDVKEISIIEEVTGATNVEEIVKDLLKRPEHIEDAFSCNPEVKFLHETSDEQVFLQKSDAENHSKFLASKTAKTYER